jgi:hypothetical protein
MHLPSPEAQVCSAHSVMSSSCLTLHPASCFRVPDFQVTEDHCETHNITLNRRSSIGSRLLSARSRFEKICICNAQLCLDSVFWMKCYCASWLFWSVRDPPTVVTLGAWVDDGGTDTISTTMSSERPQVLHIGLGSSANLNKLDQMQLLAALCRPSLQVHITPIVLYSSHASTTRRSGLKVPVYWNVLRPKGAIYFPIVARCPTLSGDPETRGENGTYLRSAMTPRR